MKRIDQYAATLCRISFVLITLATLTSGCGKESAPPQNTALLGLSAHFIFNHQPIDDPTNDIYPRSHLKIQGQAYKDGAPVTKGAVNITVVSTTYKFNQSMFVGLDDHGNFESPDDAFTSIHPGSAVTITADLTFGGGRESRTIELDSESPAKKWGVILAILVVLLGLVIIFLYAFTGQTSRVKNRWAIQFSYLVIVLFLAVPIVAPVLLLRLFPAAVDGMIGYPAGLVVTRIGEPPHANAQWALNIGGYSHVCVDLCLDPGTLAQQAADARTKADEHPVAGKNGSNPAIGPSFNSTSKPADQKSSRTPPNAHSTVDVAGKNQSPTPARRAATPQITTGATANAAPATAPSATTNQPTVPTDTNAISLADDSTDSNNGGIASRDNSAQGQPSPADDLLHPERLDPDIVKVEGGLVIPLYVIVLSVIGGAINMTRKVPGFQKEGESSAVATTRRGPIARPETPGTDHSTEEEEATIVEGAEDKSGAQEAAAKAAVAQVTAPTNLSLEEQATQIDHELDGMIPAQIQRNTDTAIDVPKMQSLVSEMQALFAASTTPTLRGYRNFDEWYVSHPRLREILGGSWRVELLNQYMYLISAPFLAIVTYYILDLLGLTKPGVVVVLSFSVGLISEKIVSWILGIATGYMQTPKT